MKPKLDSNRVACLVATLARDPHGHYRNPEELLAQAKALVAAADCAAEAAAKGRSLTSALVKAERVAEVYMAQVVARGGPKDVPDLLAGAHFHWEPKRALGLRFASTGIFAQP